MTVQEQYDGLDSKQRGELLLKIGETTEQARVLGRRDYVALGGWVKTRPALISTSMLRGRAFRRRSHRPRGLLFLQA